MSDLGWQFVPEADSHRFFNFTFISILVHLVTFGLIIIYPLIFKPKSVEVPVFTLVTQPKIVVRREKVKPPQKPPPKEEIEKPKAPTLKNEPTKPTPREIKRVIKEETEPDPVKKEVVERVVEDMQPQMVMEDLTDPRLKFWLKRVLRKVQSHWNPPVGFGITGTAMVQINFIVERSGAIKGIRVGASSGNSGLDEEGKRTLMRVKRLPPIPPNYRDKDELSIGFKLPYIGN